MSEAEHLERFRQMDDEQLLRLAARPDAGALAVLYERHHVLAFSSAVRILGSRDRAQDVVHDAFVTLWREAGRYDPARGLVRSWLVSIVHDQSMACVRQLSVQLRTQMDATRAASVHESVPARRQCDSEHGPSAVRDALQALPDDERRIIELMYFDGWTQDGSQEWSNCGPTSSSTAPVKVCSSCATRC